MSKARRGVYAAAISPFNSDGSLDSQKLADYCNYLVKEGGCDGVAPTGTTGEGTSIAMPDRLKLPEAFASSGLESDRVIFGTGACAVEDTVEITRAVLAAGYCNVLVLPTFYFKGPTDEGLYAYYSSLIEKVADSRLRIYLYHFPLMSQIPLSVHLVKRLKDEFGLQIAGLKDSSGDFEQSRAFVGATGGVDGDFDVFPSNEMFLFDGLEIGCAGVISGTTNATGGLMRRLINAEGAEREAHLEKIAKARSIANGLLLIPAMKRIQALRTGDESWQRLAPPLVELSSELEQVIQNNLECFGVSSRDGN